MLTIKLDFDYIYFRIIIALYLTLFSHTGQVSLQKNLTYHKYA